MDFIPLTVKASCILDDAGLMEHIRLALERELPQVIGGHVALVGSGPTVKGQLESIRKQREMGRPIVAIKDAHDWLIDNGIIPDYAVAIDPQEHRWNCFRRKDKRVKYLIASQCHPAMFEHLKDMDVRLWHLYIRENQEYPPNSFLISGGTTTGLRAMTLFYAMGYRRFELYGYDSCVIDGDLRMNGFKPERQMAEVFIGASKRKFLTTPEMASQANEFQNLFKTMPDMEVVSYGDGMITAILEERGKIMRSGASFIHAGNVGMASFRYRTAIPARELGVSIGNVGADVIVLSKPSLGDDHWALKAKNESRKVVMDICDDHLGTELYKRLLQYADCVTCPTPEMEKRIAQVYSGRIEIISDPYEYPLMPPHCNGGALLWFGHGSNAEGIQRIAPQLEDYSLRIVSNMEGAIPWSNEIMPSEFARADIVILPTTSKYKSANRAVEAIRQGCFVVAEPHPSLNEFPGIWIGSIKEGVQWASQNPKLANDRTLIAQAHTERFAPERTANAWRSLFKELGCTLDAAKSDGTDGSISTSIRGTSTLTYESSP